MNFVSYDAALKEQEIKDPENTTYVNALKFWSSVYCALLLEIQKCSFVLSF